MANAVVPLLQVLLYQHGSVPYFGPNSDRGCKWFSRLDAETKFGRFSYQSAIAAGVGEFSPHLEYIGTERMRNGSLSGTKDVPIGLVHRPFIIPKDISSWGSLPGDGGTWETIRSYRNPPVTRLVQHYQGVAADGSTTYTPWGMESGFTHPPAPSFAFSILPPSASPEFNELVGGVPYCEFAWSSGAWAIRFYQHGNPILFRTVDGSKVPLMELQSPVTRGGSRDDPAEIVVIVRVQRGALMVSTDGGATYDVWFEPIGSVSVPQGTYRFSGIGTAASLGLHQVVYVSGYYDSPEAPMERSRNGAPTYGYKGAGAYSGTGDSISVTDRHIVGPRGTMKYRISMTPASRPGHWTYYYSPEVYVVQGRHPTASSDYFPIHDNGATFEGRIRRAAATYPRRLDESTFTFNCRYTVAEGGVIGAYIGRYIEVYAGEQFDDGSDTVDLIFCGFIVGVREIQRNSVSVDVEFRAENTALRPKEMAWRDTDLDPYDGLTPNEALLRWAEDMGLDETFVTYHSRGNEQELSDLFPEQPTYLQEVGEPRWALLEKAGRDRRLELGVLQNGRFAFFPSEEWTWTPRTWRADPLPTESMIEELSLDQDGAASYTGVLVRGKTPQGEQISAVINDPAAETNILSGRFRPWPKWHVETVDTPVDAHTLGEIAIDEAYDKIGERQDVQFRGELAGWMSRRDAVWVLDTAVGNAAVMQIGVESMTHVFDKEQGLMAWTEVQGRRLRI